MKKYRTIIILVIYIIFLHSYLKFYVFWGNCHCWADSYTQNGTLFWIITPDIYSYSDKNGFVLELDNANYETDMLFFNDSLLVLHQMEPDDKSTIIYYNRNTKKVEYGTFSLCLMCFAHATTYIHEGGLYTSVLNDDYETKLIIDHTNAVILSDTLLNISITDKRQYQHDIGGKGFVSNELKHLYLEDIKDNPLTLTVRDDSSVIQLPYRNNEWIILNRESCLSRDFRD